MTGDRGKLRKKELRYLYSLAYVIGAIESRGMRWARHVARVGGKEINVQIIGWEITLLNCNSNYVAVFFKG